MIGGTERIVIGRLYCIEDWECAMDTIESPEGRKPVCICGTANIHVTQDIGWKIINLLICMGIIHL